MHIKNPKRYVKCWGTMHIEVKKKNELMNNEQFSDTYLVTDTILCEK